MFTDAIHTTPPGFDQIQQQSNAIGFSMPSDLYTGSLLQTLVAAKPGARVLEIGTGTGLATVWLLAGMDAEASLVSIDTETAYQAIAEHILGYDSRLELRCEDAVTYLESVPPASFDLIFADAWPGKYSHLDIALGTLASGGLYVIDDMLPQPNWPDGHAEKADQLVADLERHANLHLVKMAWSTGIIMATKK